MTSLLTRIESGQGADRRYHRIAYMKGAQSNLDRIEPCSAPGNCIGCEYGHPFCTEDGKVALESSP